uniref:Protein MB21D2-like n=1 Tax=Drosophila rhopaloa TaxID=1041015 RepID=A0A6P4EQK6_DRORH
CDEKTISKPLTFGEGIGLVLDRISIKSEDRQTFKEDAQQIKNVFVRAISRRDPYFTSAFRGLTLTGSNLDDVKINVPDEFDMLTKIQLPCQLEPVPIRSHPGYVFLRASGSEIPLHLVDRWEDEYCINRVKVQSWLRDNITAVIPELNNIACEGGRSYELAYKSIGDVAQTIKAKCLSDPERTISFDFVPAFEFSASEWPGIFPKHPNEDRTWYAVPCEFRNPHVGDDPLSFIACAPYWERMVLTKKQHLKDGYRLMKALRNANKMPRIFSYTIKSVFLNAANVKKLINWNQSPGRILIRVVDLLAMFLRRGKLPSYLVPDTNMLEHLSIDLKKEYRKKLCRIFRRLIKCRDRNHMTPEDLQFIFGMTY